MIRRMLTILLALVLPVCAAAAEELFPARVGDEWGYIDREGRMVIAPQWQDVLPFQQGYAIVSAADTDDALIDTQGAYVISPEDGYSLEMYDHAVRIISEAGEGFFDLKSGYLLPPQTEYAFVMLWGDDGSGPIAVQRADGLTGYVDRSTGAVAIPFRYTGESDNVAFRSGYALPGNELLMDEDEVWHEVQPGDVEPDWTVFGWGMRYHLIDAQGREIDFPAEVTPISGVEQGVVIVQSGDGTGLMTPQGEIILPPAPLWHIWEPDAEGMLCFIDDNGEGSLCGHMDLQGRVIVPARYDVVTGGEMPHYAFRNGYAVLNVTQGTILLRKDGVELARLPRLRDGRWLEWSDVSAEGCLWESSWTTERGEQGIVRQADKRFRLMRVTEDGVIPLSDAQYENARDMTEGLAAVCSGGLWGYVDASGTLAIPCVWDEARPFDRGLAQVERGGRMAYIDATGNVVWQED